MVYPCAHQARRELLITTEGLLPSCRFASGRSAVPSTFALVVAGGFRMFAASRSLFPTLILLLVAASCSEPAPTPTPTPTATPTATPFPTKEPTATSIPTPLPCPKGSELTPGGCRKIYAPISTPTELYCQSVRSNNSLPYIPIPCLTEEELTGAMFAENALNYGTKKYADNWIKFWSMQCVHIVGITYSFHECMERSISEIKEYMEEEGLTTFPMPDPYDRDSGNRELFEHGLQLLKEAF